MQAGALELVLMANIARLQQDMDKAKSVVGGAMSGIERAAGIATNALGALGIGLSINAFANLIKGSINAQDELGKMSQRIGVSVESLAGLDHASKLSGTSLATVEKALKTVSAGMLDARRGLAGAKENFAALGISVTDSSGALRSADAVMIEVADRFATMKDGTEKAAIATKLFGRAGLELIPMLNAGSAGLAAMISEGQRLNPVTTASAAQAEIFNDNMDRLKGTMSGFVTQVANSYLPILSSLSQKLVDLVNGTNQLVEAQDELMATIGTKSKEEIVKMVMALDDMINPLQRQIDMFERMGDKQSPAYRRLRDELERLTSEQSFLTAQLTKIRNGYVPVTAATDDLADATGGLTTVTAEETAALVAQAKALADHQKKVRDTIDELASKQAQLHMTGREQAIYTAMVELGTQATSEEQRAVAASTAALYDQESALKVAGEEWDALVKELEVLGDKQVKDAEEAQAKVAKAHEEAAEQAAEEWRQFRNDLSRIFQDTLFDKDGNFFDGIKNAFNDLWKKIVSDMLASGVMSYLTGRPGGFSLANSLGTSGVSGQMVSAGIARFAPGLASSLGLTGAGIAAGTAVGGTAGVSTVYAAGAAGAHTAAGLTTSAIGAGSTTAAGAGAGLMSTVGAAIPWIAAAYALYSIFKHDETPSHNAGFLLNAVPGARPDQMFPVAPFESGVAPVGFSRRTEQADSTAIIDAFRDDDARITRLLRGVNPNFSVSSMGFNGYDEAGMGSGRFIGSAWEEGRPGTGLEIQRDSYARQLIAQAAAFLEEEVLNRVLSAGNTEAMIAELERAIGMTEEVAAVTQASVVTSEAAAQAALDAAEATGGLTSEQQRLLDQLYPLEAKTREYEDSLELLQSMFGVGTAEYIDASQRLYEAFYGVSEAANAVSISVGLAQSEVERMLAGVFASTGGSSGKRPAEFLTPGMAPREGTHYVNGRLHAYVDNGRMVSANGSHAAGLDYVPFDGYRALTHEGEGILTKKENRDYRSIGPAMSAMASKLDSVVAELVQVKTSTRDTKMLLRRVTRDGQSLVTTPA